MGAYEGLLDQLEDAVGGGSLSRRADVLRRVTDLFMSGSGSFSEPQLELFDEDGNPGLASGFDELFEPHFALGFRRA